MRIAFVLLAACSFSKELATTDGAPPIPDGDLCAKKQDECVSAEVLRTCSGKGAMYVDKPCPWGCKVDHCGELVPAAGVVTRSAAAADTSALADLVLPGGTIVDSSGAIGTMADPTSIRTAGPGLQSMIGYSPTATGVVFTVKKLRISGDILLVGTSAIAIVATDAIVIEGVIDARGRCTNLGQDVGGEAGPGGYPGGAQKATAPGAGAGTGGGTTNTNGGGGGGHGGNGGNGGGPLVAAGGPPFDPNFTTLVGGGGGGGGGGGNANTQPGGGGGGALQLISNTSIEITSTGGINAGGCGGFSTSGNDSGAGGGAGGTIILEAPQVTLGGALAVNGGGGGAGGDTPAPVVGHGEHGRLDRMVAAGDVGQASGGAGGAGAVLDGTVGLAISRGGGGGGAVGRMLFNTRDDARLMFDDTKLSPNFMDLGTTCRRGSANVQ